MPAFFEAELWSLANPEFWVGVGFVLFMGILWMAGAFKTVASSLDAKAATIKTDLDEAARIRAEAEAMLADIKRQSLEAEAHAKSVIEAAEEQATRMAADSKVKLAEELALRTRLAERKIEAAQAEAASQVRAAAIDLAARATEEVLTQRLAGAKSDPLIDKAIGQLAGKLQ